MCLQSRCDFIYLASQLLDLTSIGQSAEERERERERRGRGGEETREEERRGEGGEERGNEKREAVEAKEIRDV